MFLCGGSIDNWIVESHISLHQCFYFRFNGIMITKMATSIHLNKSGICFCVGVLLLLALIHKMGRTEVAPSSSSKAELVSLKEVLSAAIDAAQNGGRQVRMFLNTYIRIKNIEILGVVIFKIFFFFKNTTNRFFLSSLIFKK